MIWLRLQTVNPFLPQNFKFSFQERFETYIMERCAAVQKKGSIHQCKAKPVFGHTLCGRHAKMKTPVLWTELHKKHYLPIVRIQSVVRGWIVRKYLRLCGKGVLSRKDLINDEDLVTMEDKTKQYPFDFFSIEENGKVWWFDFGTIYIWLLQSHKPVNPYSKQPLQPDVRKRLREIWGYRQRHQMDLPQESEVFGDRLQGRLNLLCQTFSEFGFDDIHPNVFINLPVSSYYVMFSMIEEDVRVSVSDTAHYKQTILEMCRVGKGYIRLVPAKRYILMSTLRLVLMLSKPKDPYVLVFTILSALHRC